MSRGTLPPVPPTHGDCYHPTSQAHVVRHDLRGDHPGDGGDGEAGDDGEHHVGFRAGERLRAVHGEPGGRDDAEAAAAREAIAWMLARHDPCPALAWPGLALDRHWTIVGLNPAAGRLFWALGLEAGSNLVDAFLDEPDLRAAVENGYEVARQTRERLAEDSLRYGGDPVLDRAVERLDAVRDGSADAMADGPAPAFVPVRYRWNDTRLAFLSAFAHFATAHDIALAELRTELMFPADDATRDWLEVAASAASAA